MFYARRRDSVLAHCIATRLPVERAADTVPIFRGVCRFSRKRIEITESSGVPVCAARGFSLTGHAGLDSQPCAAVALCRSATVFSKRSYSKRFIALVCTMGVT